MPLKHAMETMLIVLLALLALLTGFLLPFLPPIEESVVPWTVAFAISLAYPLILYPLFKSRRADYMFRALHFAPALMLLVWLILELSSNYIPSLQVARTWYTKAWSLPAVLVFFFLLALFCVNVLRQRAGRLSFLLALLLPFAALGFLADRYQWNTQIASMLWGEYQGTIVNTEPSDNADEEQWRMHLRRMERRRQRLDLAQSRSSAGRPRVVQSSAPLIAVASVSSRSVVASRASQGRSSSRSSRATVAAQISSRKASQGSTTSAPPRLTSSGIGVDALVMVFVAGYCAVVHQRARRRTG